MFREVKVGKCRDCLRENVKIDDDDRCEICYEFSLEEEYNRDLDKGKKEFKRPKFSKMAMSR